MDRYHAVNGTVPGPPGRGPSREQVVVCLLTVAQKKPMFVNSLTALVKVTMLLLILGVGSGFWTIGALFGILPCDSVVARPAQMGTVGAFICVPATFRYYRQQANR